MPTISEDKFEEYTITGNGDVYVKTVTRTTIVNDDGSERVLPDQYHRRVVDADADISGENSDIQAIAGIARSGDRIGRRIAMEARNQQ